MDSDAGTRDAMNFRQLVLAISVFGAVVGQLSACRGRRLTNYLAACGSSPLTPSAREIKTRFTSWLRFTHPSPR